jgi:hypothetical protein
LLGLEGRQLEFAAGPWREEGSVTEGASTRTRKCLGSRRIDWGRIGGCRRLAACPVVAALLVLGGPEPTGAAPPY